jgi:hypothetical protein
MIVVTENHFAKMIETRFSGDGTFHHPFEGERSSAA